MEIDATPRVEVDTNAPGHPLAMAPGKILIFATNFNLFDSLRQNSTEKGDSLSSGGSSSPVSLEHQKSDEAISIHSEKETDDITAMTSELTIQE